MKLIKCSATNFGSYKEIEFSFEDLGLSLIYGPTGSGKSTLLDLACWALYGVTAKGGSVDEIKQWSSTEKTHCRLDLYHNGEYVYIYRSRGKSSENDLFWSVNDKTYVRGKDIKETQERLNSFLGVDKDTFIASCYFHEFSSTSTFFKDSASKQRALFENITNLQLPLLLAEKTSVSKREINTSLSALQIPKAINENSAQNLYKQIENTQTAIKSWQVIQDKTIQELEYKRTNFDKEKTSKLEAIKTKLNRFNETTKNQINKCLENIEKHGIILNEVIQGICPTCGNCQDESVRTHSSLRIEQYSDEIIRLEKEVNPFLEQYEIELIRPNFYEEQLNIEKQKQNPNIKTVNQLQSLLQDLLKIDVNYRMQEEKYKELLNKFTHLNNLSYVLRGKLLTSSIMYIEQLTNEYLTKYFDALLKVKFTLDEDSLNVELEKNGYSCSYTQLSKGQRGLLKLCFAVSIMRLASERAGVHFDTLFFDEALDGLDSDLKVKAFSLFQHLELNHKSILLIEHAPEFQNMFDRKFKVVNESDVSNIYED